MYLASVKPLFKAGKLLKFHVLFFFLNKGQLRNEINSAVAHLRVRPTHIYEARQPEPRHPLVYASGKTVSGCFYLGFFAPNPPLYLDILLRVISTSKRRKFDFLSSCHGNSAILKRGPVEFHTEMKPPLGISLLLSFLCVLSRPERLPYTVDGSVCALKEK